MNKSKSIRIPAPGTGVSVQISTPTPSQFAEAEATIAKQQLILDAIRMCIDTENDRDEQLAVIQEEIAKAHVIGLGDLAPAEDLATLCQSYRDYATAVRVHAAARTNRMELELATATVTLDAMRQSVAAEKERVSSGVA